MWDYELSLMWNGALILRSLQSQRSLAREMQSEVVSGVLKMGYRRDLVWDAVEQHLWEHDCGFSSELELAIAVLELENEKEAEERRMFPRHPELSEIEFKALILRSLQSQRSLAWEMQSEVVSGVLKMGYRRDLVRDAVEQHLWEHDCGFSSWVKLVNAVLDLQEKEDRMRHSGPSQMGTLDPGLGTPQIHKRHIDPREQYKSKQRRLASFATWPAGAPMQPREPAKAVSFPHSFPVSVFKMAEAGFYYSGTGNRVVCFSCGGSVEGWEFGGTAMGKHKRLHPHGDSVNGRETRNKPLLPPVQFPASVPPAAAAPLTPAGRHYTDFLSPAQQDKLKRKEVDLNNSNDNTYRQPAAAPPPVPQAGRDIDPGEQYKSEQKHLDYMERHLYNNSAQSRVKPDCTPTSACQGFVSKNVLLPNANTGHDITGPGPGTPQAHERSIDPREHYKSEQRRLDSFATWPAGAPIQPRELAKAGFFYTGSDDRVQCFCCQGILRNWEVGDRAMNKHHKHFPSCQFVLNSNVGNVPIENQDPKYGDTAKGERERLHPHCNSVNSWETRNKPLPPPVQFPVPVTPAAVAPPTQAGRDYTDFFSPAQQDKLTRKEAGPNLPRSHQSIPVSPQASLSSGRYQPGLQPPTYRESGPKHPQMTDDCVEGVQAHFPNLHAQQQHMRPPDEAGAGHDVLEMGYDPDLVGNAVKQHVQDHGRGFASAHNLEGIVAVLDLEEKKEERMEISGPSQMGTGGFRCHTHDRVEERLENGSDTTTGDATYLKDLAYMGMCKMCMEADVHIVFFSCGHFTVSVCTYSFTLPPGLSTKCVNGTVAGFSP